MMGEELNASYVSDRGLLGDRAYALVDQITGKVASAKNPRKWGRLFDFRASFVDPPKIGGKIPAVRITLPDGRLTLSDKAEASSLLSEALSAQIRLMTSSLEKPSYEEYWPDIEGLANREKVTEELMPPQTFFDLATIHVLTTATIDRLRELYPQGRFEVRRFRPNVVVEPSPAVKGVRRECLGPSNPRYRRGSSPEGHRPVHKVRDDDTRSGGFTSRFGNPPRGGTLQPG